MSLVRLWASERGAPAPAAGASTHREVFHATVPEGVEGGQLFQAKTPTGRSVTVTAPNGARKGTEFQVNA